MGKPKMLSISRYVQSLKEKREREGKTFILSIALRILVLLTAVRCLMTGRYESFGTCILALLLFLLPAYAERIFRIRIPSVFAAIIYIFIFAAEILGEVNNYYEIIPLWDTMLHTTNGFLAAAVGFSMVYLLNRNSPNIHLSPFYMALAAFCFSMTIGAVWEMFEFITERILVTHDTQRDMLVQSFLSHYLDFEKAGKAVPVRDVVRTVIETAGGETVVLEGGYLDIGLVDTVKDMFVNLIGAAVFSAFGYIYVKNSTHEKLVTGLMLQPSPEPEAHPAEKAEKSAADGDQKNEQVLQEPS